MRKADCIINQAGQFAKIERLLKEMIDCPFCLNNTFCIFLFSELLVPEYLFHCGKGKLGMNVRERGEGHKFEVFCLPVPMQIYSLSPNTFSLYYVFSFDLVGSE